MARTVFVNPRRRRKTTRRKRKNTGSAAAKLAYARGKAAGMQMTRNPRRRKSTRRRRRNAGVVPFVQNPLILSNPRRRTRRRKNPGLPTLKTALNRTMSFGGGAAIGVAANSFVLNNIESPLMRNAARVAAAVLGAGFLRGELGGATGGALMYPAIQELMDTFMGGAAGAGVAATDADLDVLAADLEDVMDELDMDEDDEGILYEW